MLAVVSCGCRPGPTVVLPCCWLPQVLSNSYAFAYFFFGGDLFKGEFTEDQNLVNQNLFEDSQEQLANEVGGCVYCVCMRVRKTAALTFFAAVSGNPLLHSRCGLCTAAL